MQRSHNESARSKLRGELTSTHTVKQEWPNSTVGPKVGLIHADVSLRVSKHSVVTCTEGWRVRRTAKGEAGGQISVK